MELTPEQIAILERLQGRGFQIVAFPMYASHIGVRKGNCAALLAPVASGGFAQFGAASYLIDGNFSVRVTSDGHDWLVWKKKKLEATPSRLSELDAFAAELSEALLPTL
ncbi:MAG: hypothetical protein WB780_20810 [Candidatus Acidiferrales bacterium]